MNRRIATPAQVLAVVALGTFIAADDLTVTTTMLRQIIGDLSIPLPEGLDDAAWLVNAYLVAYVAVMPIAGRLSDVVGRRKVFVGALVVFLAGSVWIPLTTSLGPFLAGRVLTAIGGGAMVPVALAVIGDAYAEGRRGRAFGTLTAIDTLGWVWGPMFGSLLVRFLDWRWQFWLNIPLALVAIFFAWRALKEFDRPVASRRFDFGGAVALTVALVAGSVALLESADISAAEDLAGLSTGGSGVPVLPLAFLAVAALASFAWLERRSSDPLIDLKLLRRPAVGPALAVNLIVGAVLIVAMVDTPLFVNLVVDTDLDRAAVISGLVLTALTAPLALAALMGGRLGDRVGHRLLIVSGMAVVAVGFALMGGIWDVGTSAWLLAAHLAILGIGVGSVTPSLTTTVIDAVPESERGVGASLVMLARLIGLAIGLSGLTAWALARYESLRDTIALPPFTDPGYAEALDAAQAQLTATALGETFVVAAVAAALGGVAALMIRSER